MSNIQPYIILNGTDSRSISGLLISSLPPISKPQVRTQIETVDGRDGDIVTPLGFSAYDKVIKIGLTYNYDVDEIIEFFNSEGIVTFSNEPDKYYRYAIYEQIDFEKLIKFKTAEVTLHVQPFKFSTTEEPELFDVVSGQAIAVTNEGNTDSRPNLTIIGSGDIDVSLNGSQILSIELEDDQAVIIDSEDMNAYAAQSAIREVVADVDPIQDLNGYSSVWIGGAGKNKLPNTYTTQTINDVTFTVNNDGSVKVNGTASNTALFTLAILSNILTDGQSYNFNGNASDNKAFLQLQTSQYGGVVNIGNDYNLVYSTSGEAQILVIRVNAGQTANNITLYPMIRLASVSDATFEPYENIGEISGYNAAIVSRCGKNLLNNSDKTITNSSYVINNVNVNMIAGNYILSFDFSGTSNSSSLRIDDENGTPVFTTAKTITNGHNEFLINLPSKASFVKLFTNAVGIYSKFQIERGNQFTTFEAYNGQTYNIPFEQTVYGGSLNVTTGELTIDRAFAQFNGSESWVNVGGSYPFAFQLDTGIQDQNSGSYTKNLSSLFNWTLEAVPSTNAIRWQNPKSSIGRLYVYDYTHISDLSGFKAMLANTPLQICYELDNPITVQLTPTQINNLLGVNNMYSDTGDITVKHKSNGVIITDTGDIVSFYAGLDDIEKGVLLNRAITGDYDKIRLRKGVNTFVLNGNARQFVIDKFSRWL